MTFNHSDTMVLVEYLAEFDMMDKPENFEPAYTLEECETLARYPRHLIDEGDRVEWVEAPGFARRIHLRTRRQALLQSLPRFPLGADR